MPRTKVLTPKEAVADDEKIVEPDLVVPAMIDEDALEDDADDEGTFDKDSLDPFDDKYEE